MANAGRLGWLVGGAAPDASPHPAPPPPTSPPLPGLVLQRAPGWLLLATLAALACACDGAPVEDPCNDTCDTSNRTEVSTYVPYLWCDTVAAEAELIYGTYTCTSEEVDLGPEGVTMTVEGYGELEDSLMIFGMNWLDVCIEVVNWHIDITFTSEAFAAHIPSQVEIYAQRDGVRTELMEGPYAREDMEGWLLEGVVGAQNIDVMSRTALGVANKEWTVYVGNFDDTVEMVCD